MAKKIESKEITDNRITYKVLGVEEPVSYSVAELPENIKTHLVAFGLDHKLANSGAGKTGQDMVDAMDVTYDALAKGQWAVRIAQPKLSKKSLTEKLSQLDPEESSLAIDLLKKLGINL